ncbi:Myo-inositol-1-phosphate synthase-domain-containing protein [Gaertneriomyces semiglobifer]|nr:Myo-inositol-1-phosphate synthase-domain-containing protein [Gaertneriomyces semiglobifer]
MHLRKRCTSEEIAFKSGQTNVKSVMVDFLVNAGIEPIAITSYDHLGNNDGKHLSAPPQFRSKEISKSNVVDDWSRPTRSCTKKATIRIILWSSSTVLPSDSKRALDEYVSEIFWMTRIPCPFTTFVRLCLGLSAHSRPVHHHSAFYAYHSQD